MDALTLLTAFENMVTTIVQLENTVGVLIGKVEEQRKRIVSLEENIKGHEEELNTHTHDKQIDEAVEERLSRLRICREED